MTRLEDLLARLAAACDQADVLRVLSTVAHEEGYENVVLARTIDGKLIDVPWQMLPDGFAETYLSERWDTSDPVLRRAMSSRLPFAWPDVTDARLGADACRMMAGAQALGVHSDLTIPLHGVGGQCDLISLSLRHKRGRVDPARRNLVAMAAMQAWMRHLELAPPAAAGDGQPLAAPHGRPPRRSAPPELDDLLAGGSGSAFVLSPAHLRALVLVEAGERRWRMGLTRLATRTYHLRNSGAIADLERWGLIVDVPDDTRWRYYLAPSVLGHSYLRRCPVVRSLRLDVWASEVDPREVPDGMDTG